MSEEKNENPLVTVSSILKGESSKIPIKEKKEEEDKREDDSDNAEQNQAILRNKKKEENGEEKKEEKNISDLYGKSKEMGPVNEQITYKDELENIRNMGIKSEFEVKDRSNFIKRANIVENDENSNKDNSIGIIPSLDINPNELITVDEEDGEVDYLEAEKAYELSVFLVSHKFIKNCKNFDKKFIELVKREIIIYERNLL